MWTHFVSAEYLPLLTERPQIGRYFAAAEDDLDAPSPVVVIGDGLWTTRFHRDPSIIGTTILLKGLSYRVIGVAPKDFTGIAAGSVQAWLPASGAPRSTSNGQRWYEQRAAYASLVLRLSTGVSVPQVEARATSAVLQIAPMKSSWEKRKIILGSVLPGLSPEKRRTELTVATRIAAVSALVLLIACANVTVLLLVRAQRRRRELAIRLSLGASRARLLGQLLTESLTLALLGGLGALAVGWWGGVALRRTLFVNYRLTDAPIDGRILAITLLAAAVVGLVTGVLPALHGSRHDLSHELKSGGRSGAARGQGARNMMLIAQTAFSLVLLAAAALCVQSLRNVRHVKLGYDADRVVFASASKRDDPGFRTQLPFVLDELAATARSLPGVEGLALAWGNPMQQMSSNKLSLPGRDSFPALAGAEPNFTHVSPGYFAVTGIPLLAGRDFSDADNSGGASVMVISENMARGLWPGENAIGKCIIFGSATGPCIVVVGIAGNIQSFSVTEPPQPVYWLPLAQPSAKSIAANNLALRVAPQNARDVAAWLQREMKARLPLGGQIKAERMSEMIDPQISRWRLNATLFSIFGALALLISAVGVFSVVSYSVSQRAHEMGVRIALGATTPVVVRLVLGSGLWVVTVGAIVGTVAARSAGRVMESILFGVSARDPRIIAVSAVLLLLAGLAACIGPAWTATRVDPMRALQAE